MKAFKIFLENKTLVEVLIILNIQTQEVLKIHSEFLLLQNRGKLAKALGKKKERAAELIRLDKYLDRNQIKIEKVWKHVDFEKELNDYKLRNKSFEYKNSKLNNLIHIGNLKFRKQIENTSLY